MPEFVASVGGAEHAVAVRQDGDRLFVTIDGRERAVALEPRLGSTHFALRVDARVLPVVIRPNGDERIVGIGFEQYRVRVERRLPIARRAGAAASGRRRDVTAPMPGLVVSVEAAPGDIVERGGVLLILEAMKMQSEIRAPVPGRVAAMRVQPGQEVMGGAVLAVLEPTE